VVLSAIFFFRKNKRMQYSRTNVPFDVAPSFLPIEIKFKTRPVSKHSVLTSFINCYRSLHPTLLCCIRTLQLGLALDIHQAALIFFITPRRHGNSPPQRYGSHACRKKHATALDTAARSSSDAFKYNLETAI
jgi:hypothetical protein